MHLKQVSLQHFRSYSKAHFSFDQQLTVIVGPNASGKSNLVEAISLLSLGKSFRTSKDKQLIAFGATVAYVSGDITDETKLEVMLSDMPEQMLKKKYLVNGIPKRRDGLIGILPIVLFTPQDLTLVAGQPGDKRRFLDEVLEQTDPQYASSLQFYSKALRQRNALLEFMQKSGRRDEERFEYWDNLLIINGKVLTEKREALIDYINHREKKLFPYKLVYDASLMSRERLLQYKDAEVGAGMTLVGPQRDDIIIQSPHPVSKELEDVKYFCSRGQQRLVTLELKNAQIAYFKEQLQVQPLLILDDIFSELDSEHITHVLQLTYDFQTIITTTHKEFLNVGVEAAVIELGK
ncbi:MAG TPA: DNA replication and repair protein RecF [Candidatus Sulfotelmatobacter sp.]|jgi:DNA replication and repair protein RecF|nr:DNA replication and repair protein RecF [Candidatus Sulfotelmatobacter sp.]